MSHRYGLGTRVMHSIACTRSQGCLEQVWKGWFENGAHPLQSRLLMTVAGEEQDSKGTTSSDLLISSGAEFSSAVNMYLADSEAFDERALFEFVANSRAGR